MFLTCGHLCIMKGLEKIYVANLEEQSLNWVEDKFEFVASSTGKGQLETQVDKIRVFKL